MDLQKITIHFAHAAYPLSARFAHRETGIPHFQTWTLEETRARIGEAEVLVISGFWRNDVLLEAPQLRFVQSCAAGYDHFDQDAIRGRGVRLAAAGGANVNAVSDHAMALVLALSRQLHTGRDNQRAKHWRSMISEIAQREDELPGKTMLIFGLGKIGSRIARLAKAFDVTVLGVKRDTAVSVEGVDELHPPDALPALLPRANFVVLACPLTAATRNVIDSRALATMAPGSYLVNVARGGCVDEGALIEALQSGAIAGAAIDVVAEEPLAADSPLWSLENCLLTPHTGGETRKYEENVLDILLDNLDLLSQDTEPLRNQVV